MKIALFTNGIYPFIIGGMQKHSYYLAKYMAREGVYVDIYNFVEYDEEMIESLIGFSDDELKYINHYCIKQRKIINFPGHYLVESYYLSRDFYNAFLESDSVDFVYAQGFSGWYYSKQRSKGIGLPPIGIHFHGLNMFQIALTFRIVLEDTIFRFFTKRILKSSDYLFSLGGKLTLILQEIVDDDKKIIETSIGIGRDWIVVQKPIKSSNKIKKFIFVGRYSKRKGIKCLLRIINELLKTFEFEFHFIGSIPRNMQIDSNSIFYHGLIKNENRIKSILLDMDILVLPSYSEGMPTVILEAMASGCAIIATDVGAVNEQVDSSNGWLVEAGNISSLKEAIISAIECKDELLTNKKRNSIRKIKDRFLWESVIEETIEKIELAMKEAR